MDTEQEDKKIIREEPPEHNAPVLDEGQELAIPVSLYREEYIRFSETVFRLQNRRRRMWQFPLVFLLLAGCIVLLLIEGLVYDDWNYSLFFLVILIAVISGFLFVGWPLLIRRSAGKSYDRTCAAGYSFDGVVHLYDNRVEKVTTSGRAVIHFGENALYLETADMIALLSPASKAIVLPARCLTADDAVMAKKRLLPNIAPVHRVIVRQVVPLAHQRIQVEEHYAQSHGHEPIVLYVQYTAEEYLGLMKDLNRRSFTRAVPFSGVLACTLGVIGWLVGGPLEGLMMFLLSVGVSLGIMLMNRQRAKRLVDHLDPTEMRVQFRISEKDVSMRVNSGQEARLEWRQVTHAVEQPDCVEFYGSGNAFWRIPKRCIPDMDELRRFVNQHVVPKADRNA